jgi:hypothetical protein
MALPLIAAGIAARAVGKKLASRAVGGITKTGAKQVNPVYRQSSRQSNVTIIGNSKNASIEKSKQILRQAKDEGYLKKPADTAKGNKRGLKAANKPVSKNNEKVYSVDIKAKKMGVLKPGQTTEYTRNQLKNVIKPARPNRTRGGNLRGE